MTDSTLKVNENNDMERKIHIEEAKAIFEKKNVDEQHRRYSLKTLMHNKKNEPTA